MWFGEGGGLWHETAPNGNSHPPPNPEHPWGSVCQKGAVVFSWCQGASRLGLASAGSIPLLPHGLEHAHVGLQGG